MPQKHFYFSIGALLGVVLVVCLARARHGLQKTSRIVQTLYEREKHWFLYFPAVIFLIGCWGLVPDIIHALKLLPKEITRSGIFDVFFFHSTFEKIEDASPLLNQYLNWIGEAILGSIAIGVMFYYVSLAKRAVVAKQGAAKNRHG